MKNLQFKWLLLSIVLSIVSVNPVWAKIVFYNDNGQSGTPKVYFWGGDNACSNWDDSRTMTNVTGNIYYYDIGNNPNCIFRYNNTTQQTGDLEVPSDKNYMATYNADNKTTWSTYQLTSTASLSANKTSMTTAQTSTLTPSLTSNTTFNEIKSTSYSVTTNPGRAGSMSGNVFSATAAGTYTVTATVTYNAKGFSGITKTATATKNITVTAASTYTLSYNGNGNTSGTAPSSSVHAKNAIATVAVKGDLAMTNYTFSGWNTSQYITGTDYAASSNITMSSDITLYAKWTRTVTLDQNGATTNSSPTSVTGIWNCSKLPTITNPSKDYYSFQGWNTKADVAGSIVINTSGAYNSGKPDWTDDSGRFARSIKKDYATLYAKWTQSVTLKANTSNHGSGTDQTATATWNYKTISIPTHCTPADGYKLEGYYTAATGGTKILNADGTYAGTNVSAGGDTYISSSKWAHAGTTTLWAHYEPKTKVRLYTSNPDNWGTVYAYVWSSSNTGDKNAAWHGVNITSNTLVRNGETFYYYEYYKEDHPNWNRVIFNDNGSNQTNDISFDNTTNNGQYHSAGDRNGSYSSGSWNALPAAETTYSITFNAGAHGSITAYGEEITAGNSANVEIGSTARSLTATNATGYHFNGWTKSNNNVTIADASSASTTISASGTSTVTATWAANTYTITLNDNGGSGGDGTHSVTYNSATSSLTNAPERDHYTFDGYYASSGGTGTKVFNANLTPVQNAATYTDNTSDKKWIYAGDKELYAKWTEIPYTVTLQNATESSVSAGCETGHSITAASAPFGMGFNHWEVVSGSATFVNANSATTTVKATSDATVKAVYAQNLYAFIEGRFHVADASNPRNWTNTFSEGNWDHNSTSIPFSYDPTKHVFYLHTYAKASELTTQISSINPYFYIKTSTSSSSAKDAEATVKSYKCNESRTITAVGYEDNKVALDYTHDNTTNDKNDYLRFNSTDATAYITIFFDGTYIWYEYMPAIINTINLSATRVPPMAEITATPSMSYKGATDKAYCWGVYSDAACTSPVNVSFTSLGSGRVQFTVPQTIGTYYLKLTVRASAACNASIDDEEVQSFQVTTSQMVFFKNVPGWASVHFYYLGKAYWNGSVDGDDGLGSGCNTSVDGGAARGMTRIGNSDIYYYDYSGNSAITTHLASNPITYVAFTDNYKPKSEHFSSCQAIYRGDFSECAPMLVPENHITCHKNTSAGDGSAAYYQRGYWTNYMSERSGFSLYIWDQTTSGSGNEVTHHEMTGTIGNNSYTFTYNFANDPNNHSMPYIYGFKAVGCGGSYYGAGSTMDMTNCTDWNLGTGTNNCGLKVAAKLEHKFILTLAGDGHVQVSVEYPVNVGDYRLLYDDNTQHPHPSQFIRKRANGKDTVAMYIRPTATEELKVQYCTGIDGETITWEDYAWNSGSAAIDVSGKADGVYNFYLEQDASGNLSVNTSETKPYSGLYYIRTQSVDGGWNSYKSTSDNLMTYAQYPDDRGYGFNYYKAKWVGSTGSDVTYTIACDYSPSLSDTLVADPGNNPLSAAEARNLPHSANIRFGWHSKTNQLKREYINGSSIVSDRYLVMIGDEKLKDSEGEALDISGLNANEIGFTDLNNWIYRCDVTAVEGAKVKLIATYDSYEQYFIGTSSEGEEIIGGTDTKEYLMRVTYDFKTNRLMTAWLPDGDAITSNMTLNADMMLIREGQNAATQVYFGESAKDKKIDEIHSIYGVMEFQYSKFANQFPNWSAPHAYEYLMYYISFPFDVKVSEIFGCGVRGKNWIIQKYNGAKRAKIGWFAETSTFWETLPGDSTLHAHEGYLLLLDRISFNDPGSNVWTNRPEKVYLYFPSISNTIGTISDKDKSIEVPSHVCGINRSFTVDGVGELNHRNTDSHWNVIGTPLFETKNAASIAEPEADGNGEKTLQYYYAWDCADNTLSARPSLNTSTEFKSMHGYMVQYAGTVTFHGASIGAAPASVAARHMPSDEKNYRIELQLINENGKTNRTYVELRENACDTFALNEDMYMMRSSRTVDLYSFAGAYDVAANVLSMNNHIVPVGTDVKVADTYRFTMPSDFSGTVTLIDTETGTRTNLAFGDYEVNLPKGTSNNRFFLEININKMPTAIDGVDGGSLKDGKAHKFIQNGQMYILRNGVIYDAQGKRVK